MNIMIGSLLDMRMFAKISRFASLYRLQISGYENGLGTEFDDILYCTVHALQFTLGEG